MRTRQQHDDPYEKENGRGQRETGDKRHRHRDYADEREHWPDDDERR